jgi:hypothetical protein
MKVTQNNIFAASQAMGETTELIRLCVNKGADGCNANGTFNTLKLGKWIDAHRDELEAELPDTYEYHKKAGKVKENRLADLKIKAQERTLIEPDEVKELLTSIATTQSSVLKRIMNDLPIKCAGKSEPEIRIEVNKAIHDVFSVLQKKADSWK